MREKELEPKTDEWIASGIADELKTYYLLKYHACEAWRNAHDPDEKEKLWVRRTIAAAAFYAACKPWETANAEKFMKDIKQRVVKIEE